MKLQVPTADIKYKFWAEEIAYRRHERREIVATDVHHTWDVPTGARRSRPMFRSAFHRAFIGTISA